MSDGKNPYQKAREAAETIFDLAHSAEPKPTLGAATAPHRFWETLKKLVDERLTQLNGNPPDDMPMNEVEARRFESRQVPFGKYKDAYVSDVPFDYLEYMVDPNPFMVALGRYVRSEAYQERKRNWEKSER